MQCVPYRYIHTRLLAIHVCLVTELSGVFHESSDCRFGLRRVESLYMMEEANGVTLQLDVVYDMR